MDNHSFDFINVQGNTPADYLAHDAHMSINELLANADMFGLTMSQVIHLTKTARILAEIMGGEDAS